MNHRPLTPHDADAIHTLLRRWENHWLVPRVSTPSRAMKWLLAPSVTMAEDTMSFWDGDALVAYGLVSFAPSGRRREMANLSGLVDPDHRGEGIGRTLLDWLMTRARKRLEGGGPSLSRVMRTVTWDWIDDAVTLYQRCGFDEARRYDEMLMELGAHMPARAPDGVEILPWDRARDEDPGLPTTSPSRITGGPSPWMVEAGAISSDPRGSGWASAVRPSEAGESSEWPSMPITPMTCLSREGKRGWIRILSVDPARRGEGIATALLRLSHNSFIDAGYSHAMVRVDARASPAPIGSMKGWVTRRFRPQSYMSGQYELDGQARVSAFALLG